MKNENKRKSDKAFDFHAGANWSKIKDRNVELIPPTRFLFLMIQRLH